eukprot:1184854-Prorocentrum_minimum.AAC.3
MSGVHRCTSCVQDGFEGGKHFVGDTAQQITVHGRARLSETAAIDDVLGVAGRGQQEPLVCRSAA